MKYLVTQTDTVCYQYRIEADSEEEATHKAQFGEGHIPERDKVIDRQYEAEESK